MADSNLTAEIEIKTNSALAKKQLQMIEKEIQKLNKVLEETEKLDLSPVNEDLRSINKTLAVTKRLLPSLNALGAAFHILTQPGLLKRLAKVSRLIALIARVKGFRALSKSIRAMGRAFDLAAEQVERFNTVKAELNLFLFKTEVEQTTTALEQMSQVLSSLHSGLVLLRSFGEALERISSPAKIARLAEIASVLSSVASIKGLGKTSQALEFASDKMGLYVETAEKAVNLSETFDIKLGEIDRTLGTVKKAFEIGRTALDVFVVGLASIAGFSGGVLLKTGVFGALVRDRDFKMAIDRVKTFGTLYRSEVRGLGVMAQSFGSTAASGFGKVSESLNKLGLGFNAVRGRIRPLSFTFIELLTIAAPVFLQLGVALRDSETGFGRLSGSILIVASVLTGAFGAAVAFVLAKIGNLTAAIGFKLLDALERFDQLATKAELTQRQFTFTIQSFADVLGEGAVGSLFKWNKIIQDLSKNTVFASDQIQKSIKLLVSEGTTLGLSFRDNQKLLEQATDIASSNGKELVDVTQALLSGLAGQSQAAFALGLNLRESAVAHHLAAEGTHAHTGAITEQDKMMARLAIITERANILTGASADLMSTAAGQAIRLDRAISGLQVALGSSNLIIRTINEAQIFFLETLNRIPKGVFQVISALGQLAGVVLVVVGTLTANVLILAGISTAYTFLNAAIGVNVLLQTKLSAVINVVNASLGIQAIAVTSLTTLFLALGTILKSLLTIGVGALFSKLAVLVGLLSTGISSLVVILGPLILKLGAILGVVVLLVRSFFKVIDSAGTMAQTLLNTITPVEHLVSSMKKGGDATSFWSSLLDNLIGAFNRTLTVLQGVAEIIVAGFIGPILLLNKGILSLRLAMADTQDEAIALKTAILENEKALIGIANASEDAIVAIATVGNESDIANFKLEKYGKAAEEAGDKVSEAGDHGDKLKRSAEEIASALKGLQEANKQLRLDISIVGSGQIEQLQKRAAFETSILDEKMKQALVEQSMNEAAELGIQKSLIEKKLAAEIAEIQRASTESILQKNQMLADSLVTQGLEGKKALDVQLALQLEKLAVMEDQLRTDGLLTSQAIAGLAQQRNLLTQISNQKLFAKQLDATEKVTDRLKDIKNITRLTGLEGSQLAKKQLRIQLEGLSEQAFAMEKQGLFEDKRGQALLRNLRLEFALIKKNGEEKIAQLEKEEGFDAVGALGDTASILSDGIMGGVDTLLAGSEEAAGNFGAALTEKTNTLLDGFTQIPEMMKAMTDQFADTLAGFVERAPEVIQGMIDALPQIIDKMVEAFMGLMDALPAIVGQLADALPDIISKILDQIPAIITKIMEVIPQLIASLISAIPQVITNILDRLPEILSALIEGFIGAMGEITAALIDTFITKGGAVKIAVAIVKAIIQSIGAIVTGISKGLQRAFKGIFGGFEIPPFAGDKLLKNLKEGLGKVVTGGLQGVSEEAFGVIDLPTGGEEGKKKLEGVGEEIKKAVALAGRTVSGLWESFLSALKNIWMWVWNLFDKFIIQPIRNVWLSVWTLFDQFIIQPIRKVWLSVFELLNDVVKLLSSWYKAVWDTFRNVVTIMASWYKAVWDTFRNVVKLLASSYKAIFKTFKNVVKILASWYKAVWDTFRNIVGIFTEWLSALWQTFMNVVKIFQEAWNVIINFFQQIFKGNIEEAFQGVFDFFAKLPEMVMNAFKPIFDFWGNLGPKLMAAFKPIFDFFGSLGSKLVGALKPLTDFFSNIGGAVASAFKPITNFFGGLKGIFSEAFKPLTNFFSADAIGGILKKAFNISPIGLLFKSDAIKNIIQKGIELLNPGSLMNKLFGVDSGLPSEGTIEGIIGLDLPYANFAKGGVVPGTAPTKGDSLLNDKILAMLSPGEFVVPRSIATMPGMDEFLTELIRSGALPQFGAGGFVKAIASGDPEAAVNEVSGAIGSDPIAGAAEATKKVVADAAAASAKALEDTKDLLKGIGILDPGKFLKDQFSNSVLGMLEGNAFEDGGPTGAGGPALLHPGEFVLKRSAVQSIGASQAEFINRRGALPQTQKSNNVTIVFEPGSIKMDGVQDPDRFVDELMEIMKRRGMDGDFVMSSSGLRETS